MKVQITIRGRTYALRSDEDEDLQAIASFVDQKMGEVASRSPRMDEYTVAMLAALNIASEYERFRRSALSEILELERELASIDLILESASAPDEPGRASG